MKLLPLLHHKIRKALGLPSKTQQAEAKRVKLLRENSMSDTARWNKQEMLQDSWNERTAILGDAIPAGSRVLEFGAANYFLRDYITDKSSYVGADIVSRHKGMLVCDLNIRPLQVHLEPYDTVVLSGVLEYVYDLEGLFKTFSKHSITNVLFSYACADHCKQNRLHNGWLSDFTKPQIEASLEQTGYLAEQVTLWKDQHLFIASLRNMQE